MKNNSAAVTAILIDMTRKKREATFGGRLKILRQDAELTQEELIARLAKRGINIGRSYISELERAPDNRMPNGDVLAGLVAVLGCNPAYLLMLSDNPEPPTENGPTYYSAEADEIANMVDELLPDTRQYVLYMVRAMSAYMAGQASNAGPVESDAIAPGTGGRWYYSVGRVPEGTS